MENSTSNYGFMAPKVPSTLPKKTNENGKPQTTSTPFHDNQNIIPSHVGSIHEYFMNGSEINTSHNSTRSVPILGNNININNVTSATNLTTTSDAINYQRVKRAVYENAESREAELKQKENMLNHLKSIDLSKYSFPNENKPRTDYTYAKSSSYLKECKELANDNVEMPNLCRRARRSPQNSFHQSASQSLLNRSDNLSDERSFSESKIGVYEKIKSIFSKSEKSLEQSFNQDDIDVNQSSKDVLNKQPGRLVTESTSSVFTGSTTITTKSQVFQASDSVQIIPSPTLPVQAKPVKKSKNKCCTIGIPLLLLLLLPLFLYGINKLDEKKHIYDNINENYLNKYLNMKINEEKIDLYRQGINKLSDSTSHFITHYIPYVFNSVKNKTSLLTDTIIDYKDATFGGFDLARNFFTSKNEDLSKSLEDIKQKAIDQTMSTFKDSQLPDVDLIRNEFDKIFNYTLTIMSNKIADQLIESKQSYESELNQVKKVITELESRYNKLVKQFDQNKYSVKNQLPEEMVSFKKIEEYINKTFYLYNADKTGMSDFASESIGGSILFTRCTEDYLDNSRWFTVLNVPITRIPVSPRVVIQGSMQPGNCWSFKGSKADLFIKLAARITPTAFSLEHIPKELSLTGLIDSAPQNFTVYGYESKDLINDDVRILLGNYRYDNESISTLQFFNAQYEYDRPVSVIELKIESNAGNKDFTCLYKFRVHGRIFKMDKPIEDDNKVENFDQIKNEDVKKN